MSLVFTGIVPHPPLLMPTIGKEALKKIEKTKLAMEKMEEELYAARPNIVVIISPHGKLLPQAFTINMCPTYETDLKEFGDLSTKLTFKGEMNLPYAIREAAKTGNCPAMMISEQNLDHGAAIPLGLLTSHLSNISILPIGFSLLDFKTHFDFGRLIKEQIMNSSPRVAVIASADLSHALTTDSPAGFNAAGKEFDAKVQELLASKNSAGLLQMDPKFVTNAAECGFRSIVILMGILNNINYGYEAYAYEAPFGVGYLTANFII